MFQFLIHEPKIIFSGIFSFLFTYYALPIFIAIAYKYNIIDIPDGKVKNHKLPTPYLGGAAIYLGFLVTLGIVFPFDNQFFLFLVGSTILFYIGLIDDLITLLPLQKFAGQVLAAVCFLRAGFYLKTYFFYQVWTIPISLLWMLILINAFNLIDIMDGLAIGVSICCAVNFLLLAFLFKNYIAALILAAMLGSFIAFFCFNKPRALIYLGDAGSLFIGGLFSIVPFLFTWSSIGDFGYLIPVSVLAIPLLEVAGLICIRTYYGIPFYKPSKHHFAHYLQRKTSSVWEVLLYVIGFSVPIILTTSFFVLTYIPLSAFLVNGMIFVCLWYFIIFI